MSASMNPFDSAMKHITKSHGVMPGVTGAPKAPPKPPDKILVKNAGGGGGNPKPKPVDDEREDEDAKEQREQANTPPAEPPVDRTVVKLSNIKWKTEKLAIGGVAWVTLEVSIPQEHQNLTGITCTTEYKVKDGPWKPGTDSSRCDAKDGKAECQVRLPEPPKGADGAKPEKVLYRVLAKHSYSEHAKGPEKEAVEGEPGDPYDGLIYYSPDTREYLYVKSEEEFESVRMEFENLRYIGELSQQAREAANSETRKAISEKIREKVKELWDGVEIIGESEPLAQEWILVRKPNDKRTLEKKTGPDDDRKTMEWSKPPAWAYARRSSKAKGTGHKGRIIKATDPELKKNLEDLMKKAPGSKEHSPFFSGDLKLKLFESDPLETKVLAWEYRREEKGKLAGQTFNFSKEAAFSRLVMRWDGADASVDLKKKKVHLGVGGSMTYGILEGKMEGEIPLPEKGFNLLTLLRTQPYLHSMLAKDRKCLVRFKLGLSAEAFAGLTVSGAVNVLDIDLTQEKLAGGAKRGPHAESGVEAKGFAGAKAEAGMTVAFEWTSPERKKFEALASLGGKGAGTAGVGAEFEWKLEYREGVFFFHGGANLTVALGLQGSFTFQLGAGEGYLFIAYIMRCMDFHFVKEVEATAFTAYKQIGLTLMTLGEAAFTAEKYVVTKVVGNVGEIFAKGLEEVKRIKHELWDVTAHSSALNNVPPESLGEALRIIMHTREDKDFRSIMNILYSTVPRGADIKKDPSANHKLKWTLRSVSPILIPDTDGPETEKKKADALKEGIKKIRDFGIGSGYPPINGRPPAPKENFLIDYEDFLRLHGVN